MPGGRQSLHEKYGLWICRGGGGCSGPKEKIQPRYFEFYSISHLYQGHGWYWRQPNIVEKMQPGHGILIAPGFIHDYGGDKDSYTEDSLCFTGSVADQLFRCGIIRNGIFEMGSARRLLPVAKLAADPSADSQIQANLALQNLLVKLYLENKAKKRGEREPAVRRLIEELKATPEKWWTVEEMASFCNLSTAQFRRVFQAATGQSPKNYLDSMKVQMATTLLCSTEETVAELAASLGYLDPFHFSRRFKQLTGFAPADYRHEARHGHKENTSQSPGLTIL